MLSLACARIGRCVLGTGEWTGVVRAVRARIHWPTGLQPDTGALRAFCLFAQLDAQHSVRKDHLSRGERSLTASIGIPAAPTGQGQAPRVLHAQGLHALGTFFSVCS